MGCDAQAYLAYGIDLGAELPAAFVANDHGFFDFDDLVLAAAGLVEPSFSSPEHKAFMEKREKALADCPASFCCYGGDSDYLRYALFVNGTCIDAQAYGPAYIDPSKLQVDEKRAQAFKEFCAAQGIIAAPRWMMVCRS